MVDPRHVPLLRRDALASATSPRTTAMLDITPEAWARARYDYEYTDRPTGDIARELGTSLNTLRDRARRWGWRLRHAPIPDEGPAPLAPPQSVAPPPQASQLQ